MDFRVFRYFRFLGLWPFATNGAPYIQPLHLIWVVVIPIVSASERVPCSAPGGPTEEGDQNDNNITVTSHSVGLVYLNRRA